LVPTLFSLTPQLLSAQGPTYGTPNWPALGSSVPLALPLAVGGGGHVCCGQFRYWVVRQVPPDVEPVLVVNVSTVHLGTPQPPPLPQPPPPFEPPPPPHAPPLNMTSFPPPPSHSPLPPSPMSPSTVASSSKERSSNVAVGARVQALFTKRGSCPSVSDVLSDRSGCIGRCEVSWLAHYDTYSGRSTFRQSTSVNGGFAPVGIEAFPSDWYVGVQALRDEPAEFSLHLTARPRPPVVQAYACSRLSHFCPVHGGGASSANASNLLQASPSASSTFAPLSSSAASRLARPLQVGCVTTLCYLQQVAFCLISVLTLVSPVMLLSGFSKPKR